MASNVNVFGTPITTADAESKAERARTAYDKKEADGKFLVAKNYADEEKKKFGDGASTLCMVYNATGDAVSIVTSHDWYGHVYGSYPTIIQNGQWAAFLHVKKAVLPEGSEAAVVYRGKTPDGEDCDFMLSWDNPWNKLSGSNHVYTMIREGGHFKDEVWNEIYKSIGSQSRVHTDTWKGCLASVSIEDGTSPYFQAILSMQ